MKKTILMLAPVAMMAFAFNAQAAAGMTKKQAKTECLKEQPGVKGKELKACIKGKLAN